MATEEACLSKLCHYAEELMNKFNCPVLVAAQVKTGLFTFGSSKFNAKMKYEYKEDEDWEGALNKDSEEMRKSQLENELYYDKGKYGEPYEACKGRTRPTKLPADLSLMTYNEMMSKFDLSRGTLAQPIRRQYDITK